MAVVQPEMILIGYWRGGDDPANEIYPSAMDFVDGSWDVDERDAVISYLKRGLLARGYMGYSYCRFCGVENGVCELSDFTYTWPEGLVHYVEHHGVRLPRQFVQHVMCRIEELEASEPDPSWWQQQQGRPLW